MTAVSDPALPERLGTFFQSWQRAHRVDTLADRLGRLLVQARQSRQWQQHAGMRPRQIDAARLSGVFQDLAEPLRAARTRQSTINPWTLAGLKALEVPNAAVLAALWSPVHTGDVAGRFLNAFFRRLTPGTASLPSADELACGYHVRVEHRPDGDRQNRVDLVIETNCHVIGIEIKMNAPEGRDQLLRYGKALTDMAERRDKTAALILLGPRSPSQSDVVAADWSTVRAAARVILPLTPKDYTFTDHLVARFAEHATNF